MLQTRKINKDAVAVAFEPTEILLRKSGRDYYGTEVALVHIRNNELIINKNVAKQFNVAISIKED